MRNRPIFHFTPPQNWTNDPNGLVFFDGEYHLFYQHNPYGDTWGHMSWGHAVSLDLVNWVHLPVAIPEAGAVMAFSGSAVVDWHDTTGFFAGKLGLVAVYTGHTPKDQHQRLAFSADRGRTWIDYPGNPVLAIGETAFRDPKVFWHPPTQRWVMVVALSDQHKVSFYASPNLKDWLHLSDFGPSGCDTGVWECPDLFQLPVESTHKSRWVLKVDVGGKGGQYFVGDFNGVRFTCEYPTTAPLWVDGGADFYAAQSWSDLPVYEDRRLWLAWMEYWSYASVTPTSPWRGMMTCPREVRLALTAAGLRLVQSPATELQKLRGKKIAAKDIALAKAEALLATFNSPCLEIIADLIPSAKGECGFKLRVGPGEETLAGYDATNHSVFVDRTRSGQVDFAPEFAARHSLPVALSEGHVRLHILVDTCSVEVFAEGGLAVISDLIFPDPGSTGVGVFNTGSSVRLASLQAWSLTKED